MKNALLSGLPVLLLASCTALNLQYKEGESVARMSTDLTACESTALEQYPEKIRTRYLPPVYLPYGYCGRYGPCYYPHYPVFLSRSEQYDANESNRNAATRQCMADQGYSAVKIPACEASVADTLPPQPTEIMPPLTENSCSIRLKSGGWQIVNPG